MFIRCFYILDYITSSIPRWQIFRWEAKAWRIYTLHRHLSSRLRIIYKQHRADLGLLISSIVLFVCRNSAPHIHWSWYCIESLVDSIVCLIRSTFSGTFLNPQLYQHYLQLPWNPGIELHNHCITLSNTHLLFWLMV